eukprot:CAMPEP_0119278128 /NCGR_PEP_ID=MMETSP1329-20130426/18527_1 /TAXON_ID=114041 /ORGANISM="Genus nov. species nov., Strain RCC1024" /LENGTH=360 /DNA_ID=CAMNT_0007278631 /DNA_START=156 /DNA_END=1234 /DNA_ORIENTATION=+
MANNMDVDDPPQPPAETPMDTTSDAPPAAPAKSLKQQKEEAKLAARPWVEKYRPNTLDDLVAHKEIVSVLRRLIAADRLPHTLLYGPPGTGKTSTILAAAKDMYGPGYKNMTLELNASDDRGIDVVRNEIKDFAGTRRLFSKGIKLIILDEADMMTSDAQAALRRVIEKYTANCRFCFICNYANKITPAIQSRCTKFRFAPLDPEQVRGRVEAIIEEEKLTIDPDAVDALLKLGRGDMRRVLNVLQAAAVSYPDRITHEAIFLTTGNPVPRHVDAVFASLLNDSFKDARANLHELSVLKGYALPDLLTLLNDRVLDTQLPRRAKAHLLAKLADIEDRCAGATTPAFQLTSVVAAFVAARA